MAWPNRQPRHSSPSRERPEPAPSPFAPALAASGLAGRAADTRPRVVARSTAKAAGPPIRTTGPQIRHGTQWAACPGSDPSLASLAVQPSGPEDVTNPQPSAGGGRLGGGAVILRNRQHRGTDPGQEGP